ncbi:MAG: ketopantoate reductase family protein [Planctomycetota bacterium]|jgi:2-dehydropantoate 2-reductase
MSGSGSVYTVFGAGSVGTVLAGLLADAGVDVRLAGRGAVGGLRLEGDEETVIAQVPVVVEPEGTILLCVHAPDVGGLCARWPGRSVVTWQNGVSSEEEAARWCRVIGGVWRMTCTLLEPGRALYTRRGRVVVGRHPEADRDDDEVEALAADLGLAGFDVGVSPRIAGDKWLKLCLNLTSAPHALIRKQDHGRPEFGALKAALLEEARDVLFAAGIEVRSCDGRDLPLEEEIERHRAGGTRQRPVYNDTWRQLAQGRRPKSLYHDTFVDLAGGSAPRNAAMLELVLRATGPECYSVDEVFTALCGTSGGTQHTP